MVGLTNSIWDTWISRFKNFMLIVKMVLTLPHGQVDVECGFNLKALMRSYK